MRLVIQRVRTARVWAEQETIGQCAQGLLLLVGFTHQEREADLFWCAEKVFQLQAFEDDSGRLARNVEQIGGALLVIPNFTLYANLSRGRRPDFGKAAPFHEAARLFDRFVEILREKPLPVATGAFGARMHIQAELDGPVTFWIEHPNDSTSRKEGG
ncbi:MAG: D-tyrosyl-tRNA(Tyr) deacylase [Firmicutes bacterium]|nr:D-tyrosyl-tRNA(Tyr) deacylase [Bacillota bacterium]